MMGLFRIYLIGSQDPLDVELPVSDLSTVKRELLSERYLEGRMRPTDGDGEYLGVLIPATRLQLILQL